MTREDLQNDGRLNKEVEHGINVVPKSELAGLRFTGIPYYSQLEVRSLPVVSPSFFAVDISALHAGGPANEEFTFSVRISYRLNGEGTDPLVVAKYRRIRDYLHRTFQPVVEALGFHFSPPYAPFFFDGNTTFCIEACYRDYTREEDPLLAPIVREFLEPCSRLVDFKETLAFVCYASEDRSFVDQLCSFLDASNVPVWYDRRELQVGDSIVQGISEGIGEASHLVIVLSGVSSKKPWVLKEVSAGLMRQLSDSSIRVLPVVIDECKIPPILSDFRFADCRDDTASGLRDLLEALR